MMRDHPVLSAGLTSALRQFRRANRISIATLAERARVSPRLISELEQGKRPNVSLETAVRLFELVGASLRVERAAQIADADQARARRAARRRRTWSGTLTTLTRQDEPTAPATAAERLGAVARTSALAVALQRAPRVGRR